ncbi:MAG: hypothetical protein KG028_10465 [Actinobacteria bacterium]|nr:hypothetical protein [Actinomycetota bacterium]
MRLLEQHIPSVGAISVPLHQESEELYRDLDKAGEIRRLRRLEQLGLVAEAWHGARHTRWEATLLNLDLIERSKALPRVKVGARVRLPNGLIFSSGTELMKVWALILNIGHLRWTFEAEAELLHALAQHRHIEALLGALPHDVDVDAWARRIVDGQDRYRFYQVLGYYRMSYKLTPGASLDAWFAALGAYIGLGVQSEQLVKLRYVFKRARRLAYLSLDAEFTPSVQRINYAELATNTMVLDRLLWRRGVTSAASDEFDGLERYLSERVYSGLETLERLSSRRGDLRRRIEHILDVGGAKAAVETLAAGELQAATADRRYTAVVRVILEKPFVPVRSGEPSVRSSEVALRVNSWLDRRSLSVDFEVRELPDGDRFILQGNAPPGQPYSRAAALVAAMLGIELLRERVVGQYAGSSIEMLRLVHDHFFSEACEAVALSAASLIFPDGRWEARSRLGMQSANLLAKAGDLTGSIASQDVSRLSGPEAAEITALAHATRGLQGAGPAIALLTPLVAVGDDGQDLLELDGFAICYDLQRDALTLTVVEAKRRQRRSRSSAVRALGAKLSNAMLPPATFRGRLVSAEKGRIGMAWRHIRIPAHLPRGSARTGS